MANSNKLASGGSYASYTYDAFGQLASETKGAQAKYLDYDAAGKVVAIYSDAARTVKVLSFAYDEDGNRIKKQDHLQNQTSWYSYDESGGLNGVYNGVQLIEQPIPYGQFYKSGGVYRYQLTDQVGTVRAIVNRSKLSNGNADVVYYADYYPFGTLLQSAGIASRYGYQGEYAEKDDETGWNNFYLRNYDPAIGRWLSTDPYGQYYSPYAGMGNNPITGFDPDGGWSPGDGPSPVTIQTVNVYAKRNLPLWDRIVNAISSSLTLPDHPYFHGPASGAYRPWQGPKTAEEWMMTGDIISMTNIPVISQFGDVISLGGAVASGDKLEIAFALGGFLPGATELKVAKNLHGVSEVRKYSDELVEVARKIYPNKADKIELHHITPKYLGGPADGALVPLNAAYHQQITNEFRKEWKYGLGKPSAERLKIIKEKVYGQYPLPDGFTY